MTGIGVQSRDKRLGSSFASDLLARQQLEEIWRGSDMGARIVETIPDEMVREGFELHIQTDAPATRADAAFAMPPAAPVAPPGVINRPDQEPKQQAEALLAQMDELEVSEKMREALCYERAYGGAGILVGADDGQTLDKPLNLKSIKSIKWLNVLTPRELIPLRWYGDPAAPKYGEVELYRFQREGDITAGSLLASSLAVHESRLILFRGIMTSRLQVRSNVAPGWGDSVLVRCNRILSDFDSSWASASILLQDFAPSVFKMDGLADLIANDEDGVVVRRALAIEMSRSTARAVMIDKEEEYARQTTPITGLDAMLEKFCLRLAAAADMPVALLMGQAPAGMNATGASDIRFFYDRIKSRQKSKLLPALNRLTRLLMVAKEGPLKGVEPKNWSIEFNPLWQLTDLEQADLRLKQAQVDKIEIDAGVATPEEIAASRHGGDAWSAKTVLDFGGREALAADHEAAIAEHKATVAATPAAPPGAAAPAAATGTENL